MKVSMKTTVQMGYTMTVGELTKVLATLPPEARISIRQDKYYDQRDPGGTWLDVTWTEER